MVLPIVRINSSSVLSWPSEGLIIFYCMCSTAHSVFPGPNRYLGGESSDMAIVDVEIPSGYLFSHHELANQIVSESLTYMYRSLCA